MAPVRSSAAHSLGGVRRVVERKGGQAFPHAARELSRYRRSSAGARPSASLRAMVDRKSGLEVACQYLGGVCGGEVAPPGGGSHENLDGDVPVEAGALRYGERLGVCDNTDGCVPLPGPAPGGRSQIRPRRRQGVSDLVRTDRHNHRRLAGDSPEADRIKVLARTHQNLIWARVQSHQSRSATRSASTTRPPRCTWPIATPWPYWVGRPQPRGPDAAPDPSSATGADGAATSTRLPAAYRKASEVPTSPHSLDRSGRPSRRSPAVPFRAKSRQLGGSHRSGQGRCSCRSRSESRARMRGDPPRRTRPRHALFTVGSIVSSTRTPSSTTPSQDSVPCSAPGRSVSSGTTPNATPAPSLAATTPARRPLPSHRAANTPSWPARSATGDSTTPSTNGRSVP